MPRHDAPDAHLIPVGSLICTRDNDVPADPPPPGSGVGVTTPPDRGVSFTVDDEDIHPAGTASRFSAVSQERMLSAPLPSMSCPHGSVARPSPDWQMIEGFAEPPMMTAPYCFNAAAIAADRPVRAESSNVALSRTRSPVRGTVLRDASSLAVNTCPSVRVAGVVQ